MDKFYLLVASRGRPKNGKYVQQLEINHTGCTNTITTVLKDNLIIEYLITEKREDK